MDMNNTIGQMDLIDIYRDIYRTLHPKAAGHILHKCT